MPNRPIVFTDTFINFFDAEKASGILLILCTLFSLALANSAIGPTYQQLWHFQLGGVSLEHWINDALMAIFFLLIGLELERELYVGELSRIGNALLPIVAAVGGIATPALIHFALNAGTPTQAGVGIPMATDIAFALGALALLGKRIPAALKVFLTALAVMDDLGAIAVIALFYSAQVSLTYLLGAFAVFAALALLNRGFRVMSLSPYLLGGAVMWWLMLKSGVHATIAGVMLAFVVPFTARTAGTDSPSHRLEHLLHKPVAFVVLPLFALANTAIVIGAGWQDDLLTSNSIGIFAGLVIGKPLGVFLLCLVAVKLGICSLPREVGWRHLFGAGLLAGIGFTMSIFIANLAFVDSAALINTSKIAVLIASLTAGCLGYLWLRLASARESS